VREPAGPGRIPLRPLYTISELARATRIERRQLRRMLAERGVELFYIGARPYVPLSELIAKLKPWWDSIGAAGSGPEEGDSDDASDRFGSE
jgi:hypothetical protein